MEKIKLMVENIAINDILTGLIITILIGMIGWVFRRTLMASGKIVYSYMRDLALAPKMIKEIKNNLRGEELGKEPVEHFYFAFDIKWVKYWNVERYEPHCPQHNVIMAMNSPERGSYIFRCQVEGCAFRSRIIQLAELWDCKEGKYTKIY